MSRSTRNRSGWPPKVSVSTRLADLGDRPTSTEVDRTDGLSYGALMAERCGASFASMPCSCSSTRTGWRARHGRFVSSQVVRQLIHQGTMHRSR